jgi:hypothetical protein
MFWIILVWLVALYAFYAFTTFVTLKQNYSLIKKAQVFVFSWLITIMITGGLGHISTFFYNTLCMPIDWLCSMLVQSLK